MAVARDRWPRPGRLRHRSPRITDGLVRALSDGFTHTGKHLAGSARSRHLFIWDLVGLTLASVLALIIATESVGSVAAAWWVVALVVPSRCFVDVAAELYQHSWRFASVTDMGRIIFCLGLGSAASLALVLLAGAGAGMLPPVAFWTTELLFAFAVVATPRFLIRLTTDLTARTTSVDGARFERTLLYGAGWAGVMVARSAQRGDAGVQPVGFLDDDPTIKGRRIAGLPVHGGLDSMARAVRRSRATSLLVTMPSASGVAVRRVVASALELGLAVRTVPPMTDLLDGTLDASRVRNVRLEDLLRRPMASQHAPEVRHVFEGRTVLITGAGGSIGSELARQILAVAPKRLVLVDRAESALYIIEREIEERRADGVAHGAAWGNIEVVSKLANVVSRQVMRRLFEEERPDIVFHAAAYKHVPMLEEYPSEAVQVNVAGTMSVVDAAATTGVERFVLVSTDKAVEPSSVMGATKRIAEMVVANAAIRTGRPYVSVRFGNVLGSNGSVVPIFQSQLERGVALTITHPEMTRYFMTIPEAAWLLLDAAALADRGGLYVLDMGTPVRIIDIARDLARLAGRDPDSVPFEYIGLRKGEKLHEELFYDQEQAQPTAISKVLRIEAPEPPSDIRDTARDLIAMAYGLEEERLKGALHARVAAVGNGGSTNVPVTELDDRSFDLAEPRAAIPLDDPVRSRVRHAAD